MNAAKSWSLWKMCRMIACWLVLSGSPLAIGDTPIELSLTERLDRGWTNELISFPITAETGKLPVDSLRLTGPDGAVAFQLSGVEPAGDAGLESARLWFVTDLAPREKKTWTLSSASEPTKTPPPETDLRIQENEGCVELTTSRFGARLLLGEKRYDAPVPAAEAPGPLARMRLGDDTWFGGSRLYGDAPIAGYSVRLTGRGPVFGEVAFRYDYADGNVLELRARLAAGDNALLWEAKVKNDNPQSGWETLLSEGLPGLVFPVRMEWWTKRAVFLKSGAKVGDLAELDLETQAPGPISNLSPWQSWFDDFRQTSIPLWIKGGRGTLRISSYDAGAWVVPAATGVSPGWDRLSYKGMPLVKSKDGVIALRMNLAAGEVGGVRKWSLGHSPVASADTVKPSAHPLRDHDTPRIGREWDRVKDYVLEWDSAGTPPHPRLYLSMDEVRETESRVHALSYLPGTIARQPLVALGTVPEQPSRFTGLLSLAWLLSAEPERSRWAADGKLAERLKRWLGLLGRMDLMRHAHIVFGLYDAIIDSELVSTADRPYLRAQMAYLAYAMADPAEWSAERGYASGNPNMTVCRVVALGTAAALLRDHPMAATWADYAVTCLKSWLAQVGPGGEWSEGMSYAHLSISEMVAFAAAAHRAGFLEFSMDDPLKRAVRYLAKFYMPPEMQPGFAGSRLTPPLGRAHGRQSSGLTGAMARLMRDADPEFSRAMQWVWSQTGYARTGLEAFGGMEWLYVDPGLPMEKPAWGSEWFPYVGAILRHGYGGKDEHYLNLPINIKILFMRASEPGSVCKWFARGRPVGGAFVEGYEHRQELLTSRVLPARNLGEIPEWLGRYGCTSESALQVVSFLPQLDYVSADYVMGRYVDYDEWRKYDRNRPTGIPDRWPPVKRVGELPIEWRRQVLFVKDAEPAGPNWLLFRDTIPTDQPTMWQFWTLSERLGTADEARNVEAFLSNKPGQQPQPPSLLAGDRFTAIGQFGLDVEYYVAAPTNTPRHTLRAGYPGHQGEYHDLLHLQIEGKGHYLVALFPRLRGEPVPEFATLGDGKIVRVKHHLGTDWAFLAGEPVSAEGDGFLFEGTAAVARRRDDGERAFELAAEGAVAAGDIRLKANGPVSMRWRTTEAFTLECPGGHTGVQMTLKLPGVYKWEPVELDAGARYEDGTLFLRVPPGMKRAALRIAGAP